MAIVAVDYDDTLDNAGYPHVGKPVMDRVKRLIEMRKNGDKIILWTCRSGIELQEAVDYMKSLGLEFDAVNENVHPYKDFKSPKIVASVYIDDRALNAEDF